MCLKFFTGKFYIENNNVISSVDTIRATSEHTHIHVPYQSSSINIVRIISVPFFSSNLWKDFHKDISHSLERNGCIGM